MNVVQGRKAVASSPRLLIRTWLLEPATYFPVVGGVDFTRDDRRIAQLKEEMVSAF